MVVIQVEVEVNENADVEVNVDADLEVAATIDVFGNSDRSRDSRKMRRRPGSSGSNGGGSWDLVTIYNWGYNAT